MTSTGPFVYGQEAFNWPRDHLLCANPNPVAELVCRMRSLPISLIASLVLLASLLVGGEGRDLSYLHKACSQEAKTNPPPPPSKRPPLPITPKGPPSSPYASVSDELAHLRALNKVKTAGWSTEGRSQLLPTDIVRMQREARTEGRIAGLKRGAYQVVNWATRGNDPRARQVQQIDQSHLSRSQPRTRPQPNDQVMAERANEQQTQRSWYRSFF